MAGLQVVRDAEAKASIAEQPFEPVGSAAPAGTVFRCALCGSRFTHGRQVCQSCPLNSGCELVTCPSCGYSFPRRSLLVDWIRRLIGRGPRGAR